MNHVIIYYPPGGLRPYFTISTNRFTNLISDLELLEAIDQDHESGHQDQNIHLSLIVWHTVLTTCNSQNRLDKLEPYPVDVMEVPQPSF